MAKAKKKTPSIADATESLTYLRQLQEKMMQGATDAEARIKKREKKKKKLIAEIAELDTADQADIQFLKEAAAQFKARL